MGIGGVRPAAAQADHRGVGLLRDRRQAAPNRKAPTIPCSAFRSTEGSVFRGQNQGFEH